MSNAIAYSQASGLTLPVALMEALKVLDTAAFRPSIRESLDELLGALGGTVDPAKVREALKAALWQKVQAEWSALEARAVGALPEKLRPLAFRLRDIQDAIDLPLFTAGAKVPAGTHFNVEGSVAVGLEVQTAKEFVPALSDGSGLLADETALRFGLDGRVAVAVKGGVTYGWGTVRAGAAATGQADADVLFARPSAEYLAASLLTIAGGGFDFGDLDAVREDRARGLRRISLDVKGSLSVSAGLTAGASAAYEIAPTAVTPKAIRIIGKAGANLDLSATIAGRYTVTADVENDGDVTLIVARSIKADRSLALELGVDVAIEGLAEQAEDIVGSLLPSPDALLKTLGEYADPIGLLKEALQHDIVNALKGGPLHSQANALALLLTGDTTAAKAGNEIAARIATRLTDALDVRVADAIAQGDVAIKQLAEDAAARLPEWLGADIAGSIQGALQSAFESNVKTLVGKLEKAITTRIAAAGPSLAQVLGPLATIGEDVNALQAKVKADIDAVVAPIKNFIAQYQALRGRIVTALKKTASEKISVALAYSITSSDQDQTLVKCRLSGATPALKTFFGNLWLGKLDLSAVLPVDGKLPAGVAMAEGRFVRTIVDQRTISLGINLFGFAASQTAISLSKVVVGRDNAGHVVMASSEAAYNEATKAFDYVKTAGIGFGFDVNVKDGKPVLELPKITTAYTVKEQKIEFADVMQYLQSLVDAGLLSNGGLGRAKDVASRGDSREARHLQDLTMTLQLIVDRAGWQHWLDLDAPKAFDVFARAYFDAASTFRLEGWDFPSAIGRISALMQVDPLSAFKEFCKMGSGSVVNQRIESMENKSLPLLSRQLQVGYRIMRQCAVAVDRVMQARETWRTLVTVALEAAGSVDPDIPTRLNALNRKLTQELGGAISSAMTFFGNERAVPVLTSGFLLGMLRATGRDVQLLPLTLAYEENGPHEIILI